ncbi:MAG: 6-pyruvoyl tetrahydropterin synthase family protein [Gemmatimonadales bacterium]
MTGSRLPGRFSVSVSKDYLTFSAAHFLTIPGHKCEALHGHNYVVTVVVEGSVDQASGFVVDFAVVKKVLRPVIDRIDHRVLVPGENPAVSVHQAGDATAVHYRGSRRFVFPTAHVAIVPVQDTTAELLACFLTGEVVAGLRREGAAGVTRVTVDVEEGPGQSGRFETELAPEGRTHE